MDSAFLDASARTLLELLGIACTAVRVQQEGEITRIDIDTPDPRLLIGWHGETLNSFQHLLKSMVRTKDHLERSPMIVVDTDGYRREQEEKVKRIADAKADFVRRTGNRIALSPMSPYFRRIVHIYVAGNPDLSDLTTESIGEGDYRQIVLKMKNTQEEKIKSGEELSPVIPADDGLENLDV